MTNAPLLPQGLRDLLPPDAGRKAAAVDGLVSTFAQHGYERVEPPLAEFEDSLLSGAGKAMAGQVFRLTDPASHKIMALRADMTPQVTRIASTRLGAVERPLRLFYSGQVLRVESSSTRLERQFTQAGAELIGSDRPDADAEVILLAVEALTALGVRDLSVDVSLPTIVQSLLKDSGLSVEEADALKFALDRKDGAALSRLGIAAAAQAAGLLQAAGRAEEALAKLEALDLPDAGRAECLRLHQVVDLLAGAAPDLTVTVDPAEHRGLDYQTGLSFTLFAKGVRGELGSGGRYEAGDGKEPATGFSLYVDSVLRAVPPVAANNRLYCPHGTDSALLHQKRQAGWRTVVGLTPEQDAVAEARRLRCTHLLSGDDICELT